MYNPNALKLIFLKSLKKVVEGLIRIGGVIKGKF